MKLKISDIIVNERLRKLDESKIKELAQSIKEIGLLCPVVVTTNNILVAGNHRLEACKLLGNKEIDVNVVDAEQLLLELMEIDENLIRNELHYIDRGDHLARRKEIYEELHPETKVGISQANGMNKSLGNNVKLESVSTFVVDAAEKLNVSERKIEQGHRVIKMIFR